MINEPGISDEKAQAILKRAAEIDRGAAEVVSIETLRAAAHEAGIAESSFDAALREHSQEQTRDHSDAGRPRRRLLVGALAGVGAAGLLLVGVAVLARLVP